jgi:tRNA 2-thiocytidine biosynthesis protein TtcA
VATFFLNLFFHGQLASMAPKLRSDDGAHIVIRPLSAVAESDIVDYAAMRNFPIIPCTLCGSQENLQRQQVQRMLADWERNQPGRINSIARALGSVRPGKLADTALFDFLALARRDKSVPDAVDIDGDSRLADDRQFSSVRSVQSPSDPVISSKVVA